jgi:hypothetical protein
MIHESGRQAWVFEAGPVRTRLASQPKSVRGQDGIGGVDHRGLGVDQRFIGVDREVPLGPLEIALSEAQLLLGVAFVYLAALDQLGVPR